MADDAGNARPKRTLPPNSGELKKAKQKLQDELLDLNVRTEIELGQDIVNVLTAEGLL
jgi:hypothetical protein